jgi:hypothetical protein
MAQEFSINSSAIESKINQLLPSQGGFGAGVDFSASTMVIPIVDLTETAEGSNVRADLQSALTHTNITQSAITGTTTTMISTTGYWRVFGTSSVNQGAGAVGSRLIINDGASDKVAFQHSVAGLSGSNSNASVPFDFLVKLEAGDILKGEASTSQVFLSVTVRQIADLSGNLINP